MPQLKREHSAEVAERRTWPLPRSFASMATGEFTKSWLFIYTENVPRQGTANSAARLPNSLHDYRIQKAFPRQSHETKTNTTTFWGGGVDNRPRRYNWLPANLLPDLGTVVQNAAVWRKSEIKTEKKIHNRFRYSVRLGVTWLTTPLPPPPTRVISTHLFPSLRNASGRGGGISYSLALMRLNQIVITRYISNATTT